MPAQLDEGYWLLMRMPHLIFPNTAYLRSQYQQPDRASPSPDHDTTGGDAVNWAEISKLSQIPKAVVWQFLSDRVRMHGGINEDECTKWDSQDRKLCRKLLTYTSNLHDTISIDTEYRNDLVVARSMHHMAIILVTEVGIVSNDV